MSTLVDLIKKYSATPKDRFFSEAVKIIGKNFENISGIAILIFNYYDIGSLVVKNKDFKKKNTKKLFLNVIELIKIKKPIKKGTKYKYYYQNAGGDSNLTDYERYALYGLLNLKVKNNIEAKIMDFMLRILIDNRKPSEYIYGLSKPASIFKKNGKFKKMKLKLVLSVIKEISSMHYLNRIKKKNNIKSYYGKPYFMIMQNFQIIMNHQEIRGISIEDLEKYLTESKNAYDPSV